MLRYSYSCFLTFLCCLHSFQENVLPNKSPLLHSTSKDVQLDNSSRTKRQEPNNACPAGQKNCVNGHQELAFLTRRTEITLFYLDSWNEDPVDLPLTGIQFVVAVDYDHTEGFIYWSDDEAKKIRKARFNGSDSNDVVSTDIEKPCEIALDLIARNLYWTDVGKNTIEIMRLTDGYRQVLIKDNLKTPRGIVIAAELGWLFWSNWNDRDSKIERSNLDGSERIVIVSEDLRSPNYICPDIENLKIYWLNHPNSMLSYADMDGTNRKELSKDMGFAYGLVLMGDYLYWYDWFSYEIKRIHKQTGGEKQQVLYPGRQGTTLKAINLRSAVGSNLCKENNGNCSELCFFRHNQTKVCSCQTDYRLGFDKRTCVAPGVP